MKKVLIVSCNGLGNGGVQNVFMNIVRTLSGKYHFDVLLFTEEKRFYDDEFKKYGDIYRIPHKKSRIDFYLRFPRIFIKSYRLLKKGKYDVIHCHNNYESGICILAAKFAGVKVRIAHAHMNIEGKSRNLINSWLNKFYKGLICKCSTHMIGCSSKAAESSFGKNKKVSVIVNPIDLNKFNIRTVKKDNFINFIHIGAFTDIKNQIFLLDVFNEIKKENDNATLVMIGFVHKADYYQSLLNKINEYQLEDYIKILPSDSDIPSCLQEADYMIFPSKSEGLGIALLEAQAVGVKCFVSSTVPEEANAGLCQFYDLEWGSKVWAEKILEFIKDDDNSACANMQPYDINNICKRYDEIYSSGGNKI